MNLDDQDHWGIIEAARRSILKKFPDERTPHGTDIVIDLEEKDPPTEAPNTWGYYAVNWDLGKVFWPEDVEVGLVTENCAYAYGMGHLGMFELCSVTGGLM